MKYDKEFTNFEKACNYKETLAKKLGESYNVIVDDVDDGVWIVKAEQDSGIMQVVKDTGKNFVKGLAKGTGLSNSKIESANTFGDVFEGAGENFISGLSGGLGLNKRRTK